MALIAAGVTATAAIGSAAMQSSAATSAAKTQSDASTAAAKLQAAEQDQVRTDLSPYNTAGQAATSQMSGLYDTTASNLDSAWNAAQSKIPDTTTFLANLTNNDGYKFQLAQGQKALDNSAAGRGMSNSGTAIKSALNFGTGLAKSNWDTLYNQAQTTYSDYNNQFTNRVTQGNSLFSQLSGRANTGEAAAAQTATSGTTSAANQGTNTANAGTATASGERTSASALSSGLTGTAYSASNYLNSDSGKKATSGSPTASTDTNTTGNTSYSSLDPTSYSVTTNY